MHVNSFRLRRPVQDLTHPNSSTFLSPAPPSAIKRLDSRIGELKTDTENSRADFAELRKERVTFSKERDERKEAIGTLMDRCNELQLLKLGRVIDLDDLEAQSDRSKEKDAEKKLEEQQETYAGIVIRLERDAHQLQEELAQVSFPFAACHATLVLILTLIRNLPPSPQTMGENTQLLNVVAELTERKLTISRELNAPGNTVSIDSSDDSSREREEAQRVTAYVQLQAREIEALRAELSMLKRKTAAPVVLLQQNPPVPPGHSHQEGMLPPIPKKGGR